MKILSPIPRKRGRIEIIPLIDIMFFLLAAFMMVSINEIKVKTLKITLPTDVPVAQLEPKEDFISVSIDSMGQVQIDKELIKDPNALLPKLQEYYAKNKDQKFLIFADKDARSGDVVAVLGKLRTAGFQKVAFSLKGGAGADAGGSIAPGASAPPPTGPAPTTPAPTTAPTAPAPSAPGPTAPVGPPPAPAAPTAAPAAPAAPGPAPAAPAPPSNP
jgi:biopolymer transport protein ExbD